jgi:hypothetical protein
MALITDPDNLTYQLGTNPVGANLTVDIANRKIYLRTGGSLTSDGVTLKCVYSKLKEIWKNEASCPKIPFPITAITDESMEYINWTPGDDQTRQLKRTAGWAEKTNSTTNREYAGIRTLGVVLGIEQIYYRQQSSDGAPTNFVNLGPANQAIQIYGDASNGNFDYRSYLKLFCRPQAVSPGRLYSSANLASIGETTLTYKLYPMGIETRDDPKITETDTVVDAYGVTVTYYASPQSRTIGGTAYDFSVIVDGNDKTAEQIYMALQSLLRKATDIDSGAGTRTGKIQDSLALFTGDELTTQLTGAGGVYIDNFQNTDINRIFFTDDTGTVRRFPYTAAFTINIGEYLQDDPDAAYFVYFTNDDAGDNLGRDFGTVDAIMVKYASGNDMTGLIGGATSIVKTYARDTNVQRGNASAGTDAPITVVAIGLGTAQYFKATATITRSTTVTVPLTANLERNYANP